MADSGHRTKRKRTPMERKKRLLLGDKVEVRSVEDGFQGSWHPGVVIDCRNQVREVKYDNLMLDDESGYLTEVVKVSGVIDGNFSRSESLNSSRGRIRPLPPVNDLVFDKLDYGLCVDAYHNEAWWEGVVLDREEGSDERMIFFPDMGDLMALEIEKLRITLDWDEIMAEWKPRGKWLFLDIIEEHEKDNIIPISIQQIWYDVREKSDFGKIGEWASPVKHLWRKVILEVFNDNLVLSVDEFLNSRDFSEPSLENGQTILTQNSTLTYEPSPSFSHALEAPVHSSLQEVGLMREKVDTTMLVDEWVEPKNSRGSKCDKWQPANYKLNLEPVFSPQSISEYLLSSNHHLLHLTTNVRNHLLYLGWKIDYAIVNGIIRVRYTSPEGKKFQDLRKLLCFTFEETISGNHSPPPTGKSARKRMPSSPHNLSSPKSNELNVKPKYCPEVVSTYLKGPDRFSRFDKPQRNLAKEARKHLKAIGWSFWLRPKYGKGEWRYDSPTTGKTYYSLRTACQAIADGRELNTFNGPSTSSRMEVDMISSEKPKLPLCTIEAREESFRQTRSKTSRYSRALEIEKNYEGDKDGSLRPLTQQPEDGGSTNRVKNEGINCSTTRKSSSTFLSKKRKTSSMIRSCSGGDKTTRVLRLSKRIRQGGPCTNSQIPRTLLSWLIENGVVLPRAKVQYRNKRSVKPMAEGRITREGIKCNCCQQVFTLSGFEAHAGSSCHRPCANIFLEDGRSLVQCQMQIIDQKSKGLSTEPGDQVGGNKCQKWNDHICSVCHYGGELILCDQCPSSFHASCISLQDIPDGDWFCPSCCCAICGESHFDANAGDFTDNSVLCCYQCERQFHAHCIRDREMVKLDARPKEDWFCSKTCEKVNWGLQQLLGKPILVGHDNLTWTLTKPMKYNHSGDDNCDDVTLADNYSKLSVALEVMHECFEPVKEPQTKRDLVEDVIFSRGSHLNRLNFRGFYTVLLERNDELITVASLRVYGTKMAEIPLIGTRFQHRRLGMCSILIKEIEKNLVELGVERLVLPAAPSVVSTWTASFGFSPMTQSERSDFLGYTFLDFQETVMCQKILRKLPSPLPRLPIDALGIQHERCLNVKGSKTLLDIEGNSAVSEVFQQDRREGSQTVDQGAQTSGTVDKGKGIDNDPNRPIPMASGSNHQQSEPCGVLKPRDQETVERDKCEKSLKFYKRKKAVELRPPGPEAKYPKLEVSCR